MDPERRYTHRTVMLRAQGDRRLIGGHAIVFNSISRNLGGFVEQIAPKAVNDSLGRGFPGVVARFNHDDNFILGTTAANTLRLQVDDVGLRYEVDPPQSRQDIFELVERGDVQHSSFAFHSVQDEWGRSDQGYPLRTVHNLHLVDIAPVHSPAYPDATAAVGSPRYVQVAQALRSLAAWVEADEEEIRKLAQDDNLRKLFTKSSAESRPRGRKAATVELLRKR